MRRRFLSLTVALLLSLTLMTPALAWSEYGVIYDETELLWSEELERLGTEVLPGITKKYDIDMDTPVKNISREKLDIIFYGTKEKLDFKYESKTGNVRYVTDYYEGVVNLLQRRYIETSASWVRDWLSNYMVESTCEKCKGTRLKKEVLNVFINKKNIYDLTDMNLTKLKNFLESLCY